jgi:hypothetical protein
MGVDILFLEESQYIETNFTVKNLSRQVSIIAWYMIRPALPSPFAGG